MTETTQLGRADEVIITDSEGELEMSGRSPNRVGTSQPETNVNKLGLP